MTRKHFIALADKVNMIKIRLQGGTFNVYDAERKTVSIDTAMDCIMRELADFCQSQNSQFNRERWMDYINGECGPNGGTS